MHGSKYLVVKFSHFSNPVKQQQQMRAHHNVATKDIITAQTPAHQIECQLIAAVLSQHLDAQTQQVGKFHSPDE